VLANAPLSAVRGRPRRVRRRTHPRPGPRRPALLPRTDRPGRRPLPRLLRRRGALRPRDGAADPAGPRFVTAGTPGGGGSRSFGTDPGRVDVEVVSLAAAGKW